MTLKYLRLLFLCSFLFTRGECEEKLSLSLDEAESIAIGNNYQINGSLHALERGYYAFKSSRAYFKPKFTFASSVDASKDGHNLDAVVRMTQPLFDKTAYYQLKEAEIEWEKSRLQVQQNVCEVLYQVRHAYNTILLNEAHLSVDEEVIHLWEDELRVQERQLDLGSAIPFDINQTRFHLKSAWSNYYETLGEIKSSQIKLLVVLGLCPGTEVELAKKGLSFPPTVCQKSGLAQWREIALQYRPQLKQEQFSYLSSQNQVRQAKSERLPTVGFYANAGNRYVTNGFTGQPYVGVGVNIDWDIYDPTNKPRVKEAEEGRKEAASNYFQVELETEAVIYALLNEIEKFTLAYQNAKEGAILAEEGMKMATRKHQLGTMSSFEYRETIKTLHEARQQVNQAQFNLNDACCRLIKETGFDLSRNQKKNCV